MTALSDSHKRTSISQLLNPLSNLTDEPPFALPPNSSLSGAVGPSQLQPDHQSDQPLYNQGATFNLRAASWDHIQEDTNLNRRKPDNGPSASRVYHSSPMNPTDGFADHGGRVPRTRADEPANYVDNTMWSPSHEIASMPYGTPAIAPMYSDERTALSGDYPRHTSDQFNQPFHQNPPAAGSQQDWQITERASVRLAVRGSAQDPSSQQQFQPRYGVAPFYPPHSGAFVVPFPHAPPQKRPASAVEDEQTSAPKSKKAKSKGKSNSDSGTSKRGYNAKKRSEAAHIAAQNAQLMPTVSYMHPTEMGKEKVPEAPVKLVNGAVNSEDTRPLHPELQFARCMSNRYRSEKFPRCVSCTRRWAGDTCRFQGIRFFLKDDQRNIVGISFVENQKPDLPTMDFPVRWNIPLEPVHIRRMKRTIARSLLPTLQDEMKHLHRPEIIRRGRESEVRATCDTCMTSIFSSSWMCRNCGREACAECFDQVRELTLDRPGASGQEIAQLQARREKHAHSNPFFLSCTRRIEHGHAEFSPVTRFCKDELEQAMSAMQEVLALPDVDALPVEETVDPTLEAGGSNILDTVPSVNSPPASSFTASVQGVTASTQPTTANGTVQTPVVDGANGSPVVNPPVSPAIATGSEIPVNAGEGGEVPCHPTKHFVDSELTDDVFRPMWIKGEPLVVTGLLSKFKIHWSPEYFIDKYGTEGCLIVECQKDTNKRVTVGEFFSWFGKYEERNECWKLKDWPPTQDFKKSFPELYEDFAQAVPVPNYVRRDGTLNLASHFPKNTVAPDLGPKMYNAMFSNELPSSKGSTRLHMDMADAVNIMTFAAPAPDGSPGCAAWDLFRAEDSDKLRKFLRKRFLGVFQHDPIHSQQVYLDTASRKELLRDYGVKSHRIYQKPGQAVFIPAGCAHQVVNLSDCVKVAVDFVSPENIERCEKLTREFREQNQSMVWKEDVLQLRSMMWFAWLSCCRQESTD